MNQKFNEATPVLLKLMENDFLAYFVGGSVRDYLLEKEIHDVDIATSATPDEVMYLFPKHVPVGVEHGTVIVLESGISYEVTTFRTESEYIDFRRPSEVKFVRLLEEDLKRRDFTINAMAMDIECNIIDLFNGKEDLTQKIIRTVGNPNERFSEDALRMMRAVRFVAQLGFIIHKDTFLSIKNNAKLIEEISIERITSEFEKLLIGKYVTSAFLELLKSDLIQYLPALSEYQENFTYCTDYELSKLETLEEKWAILLLILKVEDISSFLKKWKLPRKRIMLIQRIVNEVSMLKKWNQIIVYKNGLKISISIERVFSVVNKKSTQIQLVEELFHSLSIKQTSDISVNGRDLMEWCNRKAGSWIAEYLERIEIGIIEGSILNSKEDIKEAIKEWEK